MSAQAYDDWKTFLQELIKLYDEGFRAEEMSERYRGQKVHFQGWIKTLRLNEEYAGGITSSMGKDRLPMADGKRFRSDHLALRIEKEGLSDWLACSVGDSIRFTAKIPTNSYPFNEIDFIETSDTNEVVMKLGLDSCKPVKILSTEETNN